MIESSASFPDFAPLLDIPSGFDRPVYLELLSLKGHNASTAVDLVASQLRSCANPTPQIVAMLQEFDPFGELEWHPHVVAAVAVALGAPNPATLNALWQIIGSGTFVSPQLVAVARIKDPNFETRARQLIEDRCPLKGDDLDDLGFVRHPTAGPDYYIDRKALSALVTMCQQVPLVGSWLDALLMEEDIRQSLASDHDQSGRIATEWLGRLTKLTV